MFYHLNLVEESSQAKEGQIERKILTSKIKTLQDQLSQLAQKKVRLDLEIRRTKKKLSKIRTQSQTLVKTRVELEGFDYDSFEPSHLRLLTEQVGEEVSQELYDLDEQVYLSGLLLQSLENLPLYDETKI